MAELSHEPLSTQKVIAPFPFRLHEKTYDPIFLTNLKQYVVNALPDGEALPHFGPVYHTRTSAGDSLNIFTCYLDTQPDEHGPNKGGQSRRIILLAATPDGEIAGFKSLVLLQAKPEAGGGLSTGGEIDAAVKGNRTLIPIELAAQDILKRMSRMEGKPIRYTVYNGNLEDKDVMINERAG